MFFVLLVLQLAVLQCESCVAYHWDSEFVYLTPSECLEGGLPAPEANVYCCDRFEWCVENGGSGKLSPAPCVMWDFDRDGDFDLLDVHAKISYCLSRSGPGVYSPCSCQDFDLDKDGDFDLSDVAGIGRKF